MLGFDIKHYPLFKIFLPRIVAHMTTLKNALMMQIFEVVTSVRRFTQVEGPVTS